VSEQAVLLASFGGPEAPEEVMPFLQRVTAGRGVPPERLEEVAHHYHALGGVSPINEQNRRLLVALRAEMDARGLDQPLLWGNRNTAPFFADVLREAYEAGARRVVAVATSAYSSYSGCRQYRENLAGALAEAGLTDEVDVIKARPFYDREGFVAPFVDGVVDALRDAPDIAESHLFFTTHSIPQSMAEQSGPVALHEGSPGVYERQHLSVAARVVEQAEQRLGPGVLAWSLVYQSRSGPPQVPWLEPDIGDALRAAAAAGVRHVVVVPIGFVSDHVEVVWDLDHEARDVADELGLRFDRVATPGTDPRFVAALVDVVAAALSGFPTVEGADTELCEGTCCRNPRADLQVVAGE
jgi:ferrochelatase